MGEPGYIKKITDLYSVKIGNVSQLTQNKILRLVKQDLTKKEYKSFFQFSMLESKEIQEKLHCNQEELEKYLKRAAFKLKKDHLKNQIMALIEEDA